ncbi:MAG: hypothetical protein RMJ31_01540 [Nitrososphaerota archaeon]|nr:hypothetical protein [Nitrososphaerales archaeon]MCX8191286.1 hypothetical protein [Nitrososphaerales archaeon]MDW8044443.1 hypothetical protein [Nitrososphaerota archaeon]
MYSDDPFQYLRERGIYTLLDLALLSEGRLKDSGIVDATKLLESKIDTRLYLKGTQILKQGERRMKFPIGSRGLDGLLDGGVRTGMVTDFYGRSGVGKTQICFQLCVNVADHFNKKGLDGSIIFIDTVGTFRPERIVEIAEARGLRGEECLDRIKVMNVRSVADQIGLRYKLVDLASRLAVKLVIIDNLTENFLYEYRDEDRLINRQSGLAKHLHDLTSIALNYDIAIVVTNTVRERMGRIQESGGNVVAQMIYKRVLLERSDSVWVASIYNRRAYFRIDREGIIDL